MILPKMFFKDKQRANNEKIFKEGLKLNFK